MQELRGAGERSRLAERRLVLVLVLALVLVLVRALIPAYRELIRITSERVLHVVSSTSYNRSTSIARARVVTSIVTVPVLVIVLALRMSNV